CLLAGSIFGTDLVITNSDVGVNSLQQYYLNPDPHFSLIRKENPDGSRYPELVVQAPLDREEQSCTTQIRVVVADANDNPPVFTQDMYRVSVQENLPLGSSVLRVMATDLDEGINAEITYAFINISKAVRQLFKLDSETVELTTGGGLDFEERGSYTIGVEAKDGGRHTAHCKLQIGILDENDNAPEITLNSESKYIQEDAELGAVVALIKTHDLDSGFNGGNLCQLKGNFPFKIVQDTKNTYNPATWSCFQTNFCSKTGPEVLPNYGEGALPYSYNLCAATHSSKTEFKFLNIKPENALPRDLLYNEASWLESTSNDNPQIACNSVNLQQVSYFKTFSSHKYN
uniref:Cadherin domain-containing protein n=1 Tax=Phocoena sinus TaxID=42100 RepID=A0A8C9B9C5_PHOSS